MFKRPFLSAFLVAFFLPFGLQAQPVPEAIPVATDLEVSRLSENVWMHTTWKEVPDWGRIQSNGLILVSGNEALLIDTAWGDAPTDSLLAWIRSALGVSVSRAVVTHAHDDRIGGIGALKRAGVTTFASELTSRLAVDAGFLRPDSLFSDSLMLSIGSLTVDVYYPGAGHTPDNVVVWLPSEKLLFGGCLVKEKGSASLGNLADAVVSEWPASMQRLIDRYGGAEVVVTSHGPLGDATLLTHTLELARKQSRE
jgi:metallo-beta-lactamase class B